MKRKRQSVRRNRSTVAEFDTSALISPFAQGGFRFCAEGEYTEGPRAGKKAVGKWFKVGHVIESEFFDLDIRAMEKAVELVAKWNEQCYIEESIRVNVPEVWTFDASDFFLEDTKVLVEPFIENYQKFNSNSGWVAPSTPWSEVMQALSHFTYHSSNGEYLLCDIQGGIGANTVVLTDPAISSRKKEFGVTDNGPKGISSFFSNHRCNEFCRGNWWVPQDRAQYFNPQEGTSMSSNSTSSVSRMSSDKLRRVAMAAAPPKRLFFKRATKDAIVKTEAKSQRVVPWANLASRSHQTSTLNGTHRTATSNGNTMVAPPPRKFPMDPQVRNVSAMAPPPNKKRIRIRINTKDISATIVSPFQPGFL
jgi:Alpha-kinase family